MAVICVLAALLLSACASAPGAPTIPFEPWNRAMYAVNKPIDDHVMRPIAQALRRLRAEALPPGRVATYSATSTTCFPGSTACCRARRTKAGNDFGRVIGQLLGRVRAGRHRLGSRAFPRATRISGRPSAIGASRRVRTCSFRCGGRRRCATAPARLIRVWYGPVGYIPYVPLPQIRSTAWARSTFARMRWARLR